MLKALFSVRAVLMLCVFAALAATVAMPAYAVTVGNGDFETGVFSPWIQNGGLFYGGTTYPSSYTFGAPPYQSAIVAPGNVPCLATKGVYINQVYAGNYAARINSNNNNYHFSQIEQTFTNWDASYLSLEWSAVLQDSGHVDYQRPHFRIMVDDLTTSTSLFNYSYNSNTLRSNFSATGPTTEDWSYSGWQPLQINLPGHQGDNLKLTILASDCAQGGHDGALYVDNITANITGGTNLLPVAVPSVTPTTVALGEYLTLNGTASYDAENDPIDLYDWDFNADGIPDLQGGPVMLYQVPGYWDLGVRTLNLRVHETPSGDPAQWSLWAPVSIDVVPEPSTLVLLAIGAIGLLACARRRK